MPARRKKIVINIKYCPGGIFFKITSPQIMLLQYRYHKTVVLHCSPDSLSSWVMLVNPLWITLPEELKCEVFVNCLPHVSRE